MAMTIGNHIFTLTQSDGTHPHVIRSLSSPVEMHLFGAGLVRATNRADSNAASGRGLAHSGATNTSATPRPTHLATPTPGHATNFNPSQIATAMASMNTNNKNGNCTNALHSQSANCELRNVVDHTALLKLTIGNPTPLVTHVGLGPCMGRRGPKQITMCENTLSGFPGFKNCSTFILVTLSIHMWLWRDLVRDFQTAPPSGRNANIA